MEEGYTITGTPGITARVAAADTVKVLTTAVAPAGTSKRPTAVLITCETFDVRFSFGVDPVNSGTTLGHVLATGQSLRVSNPAAVGDLRFINKTAGSNGLLQVTYEY